MKADLYDQLTAAQARIERQARLIAELRNNLKHLDAKLHDTHLLLTDADAPKYDFDLLARVQWLVQSRDSSRKQFNDVVEKWGSDIAK